MSRYILMDENFIKINETSGTIENISGFRAEINTTGAVNTGVILFPKQEMMFNGTIYAARKAGEEGHPIVAVVPFTCCSDCGGGNGGGGNDTLPPDTIPAHDTLSCCDCNCDCDCEV